MFLASCSGPSVSFKPGESTMLNATDDDDEFLGSILSLNSVVLFVSDLVLDTVKWLLFKSWLCPIYVHSCQMASFIARFGKADFFEIRLAIRKHFWL